MNRFAWTFVFILFITIPLSHGQKRNQPEPTHKDVSYGPHERQKLDLWLANSDHPTPVVLYIHGGGFRGGSKSSIRARSLNRFLAAGISVAAIEYRLVPEHTLPTAHQDCKRAVQFLRAHTKKWNFNKTRFGAFGGSAGAQLCMWLGFHDDMVNQNSSDPIEKESTRLTCIATSGGQTTMDFDWWKKWIPGYDKPHRDLTEVFGVKSDAEMKALVNDISALSLISRDDPPIYMSYGMTPDDPIPEDPQKAQGWKVHHVMFGIKLKEKMDELGVEANLVYPGMKTDYVSREDFFIQKLKQ